jgi:hypothetical protein
MRPIPPQLRKQMADDEYYKECCLGGSCDGKVEWHHNLIYAGRQVNEKFCILPLCEFHHDNIAWFKELVDWHMLNRATDEELKAYSKAVDYIAMRERLNKKFK